jgi:hypothetical protein
VPSDTNHPFETAAKTDGFVDRGARIAIPSAHDDVGAFFK